MEKRETVGKLAYDSILKDMSETKTPTYNEQAEESTKGYMPSVLECVENHKRIFDGDFYVETATVEVKVMQKKVHNFKFIGKLACPTPTWDQSVFKYHRADDRLEYLWTIPDKGTCAYLKQNMLLIPDNQKELLNFVLDDNDGELLKKAKILNKEI